MAQLGSLEDFQSTLDKGPVHGEVLSIATLTKPSALKSLSSISGRPRDKSRARRSVHFSSLPEKHYAPVTTRRRQLKRLIKMSLNNNNNLVGSVISKMDIFSADSASTTSDKTPLEEKSAKSDIDLNIIDETLSCASEREPQAKRSPLRIRVLAQIESLKRENSSLTSELASATQLIQKLQKDATLITSAVNRERERVEAVSRTEKEKLEDMLRKEREKRDAERDRYDEEVRKEREKRDAERARYDEEVRKEREKRDAERDRYYEERRALEAELRKLRGDLEAELRKPSQK